MTLRNEDASRNPTVLSDQSNPGERRRYHAASWRTTHHWQSKVEISCEVTSLAQAAHAYRAEYLLLVL